MPPLVEAEDPQPVEDGERYRSSAWRTAIELTPEPVNR